MNESRAGYSTKSLKEKLGIKDGAAVYIVRAPAGYLKALGVENAPNGPVAFIQLFARSVAEVETLFPVLKNRMTIDGMLWVSWPKKASGVKTDLDENVIRGLGLAQGLVDVKVVAVDDTWSGLKFVYRLKDRK